MKRVVTIGGGTGQAQVLRALAPLRLDLTAIVGVTDNGGHSGELRRALGIPAVGDARACLHTLTGWAPLAHRFPDGTSLGNLILAALIRRNGSLSAAIREIDARVVPVSDQCGQVSARLEDGRTIVGEWEIIRRRPRSPVVRIWNRLRPTAEALRAVRRADAIVVCPGTLLTGTISALIPFRGAIRCRVIQIGNIMTQPGNTDGFSAADHVEALRRLAGVTPDVLLLNSRRPPEPWLRRYRRDGAGVVRDDAVGRVVRADLLEPAGTDLTRYARGGRGRVGPHYIRHDPAKLRRALAGLLARGL